MVVSLVVLVAGGLPAADKKSGAKDMDPAMQEAMKRGAPGEHHKALEPFVGRFTTTSRMWMKPGEAHLWWVATHKEDIAPEEMQKRVRAMFAGKK